ncbi:MAG: hypothetical protein ACKV2Q_01005 [Planctomycetaceae bacterium]
MPDNTGLRIRAQNKQAIIEYHLPGLVTPDAVPITMVALSACEGTRPGEQVTLEASDSDVVLRWEDRSIPRSIIVESQSTLAAAPALPTQFASNPPRLLTALKDAMETTEQDARRYAINCVQLRGRDGGLVATDGGQILKQSGFDLPWTDDVLVQRTNVFASRDLPTDQPVEIGRTDNHVVLRIGLWTLWLNIEKSGRFPSTDNVIPDAATATTRLVLNEGDAEYLLGVVPRLPSDDDVHDPVTLDLNGRVAVLAKAVGDSPITEVVLSNSRRTGAELRWQTNRKFLARAVQLGFREVCLHGAESPVVCRDEHRVYVWALLEADKALAPTDNMVLLTSPVSSVATIAQRHRISAPRRHHQPTERTPSRMSHNRIAATLAGSSSEATNGMARPVAEPNDSAADQSTSFGSVLREAEAVKASLREAHSKVGHLIASLKRHRRQSKLMKTTLASIRQLQALDV